MTTNNKEAVEDFRKVFPNATHEQAKWMAEYGSEMYHKSITQLQKEVEELAKPATASVSINNAQEISVPLSGIINLLDKYKA